jgi:hypothetical protein
MCQPGHWVASLCRAEWKLSSIIDSLGGGAHAKFGRVTPVLSGTLHSAHYDPHPHPQGAGLCHCLP